MDGIRFNREHYRKVYRAHKIDRKDGVWDVVDHPNGLYCFATGQKLGLNGRLDEHEFYGQAWCKKENPDKHYVVDSVNIHWINGYYYHCLLRDESGSHAMCWMKNINSENADVIDGVSEFNKNWKRVK